MISRKRGREREKTAYDWYITPEEYEIAARNNISATTLNKRVRDYAWSIKRATTEPTQIRNKWGKWAKIAEGNGICNSTLSSRIRILGWSEEKAATTPPMTREEWCDLRAGQKRIYPKEYAELAKKNGISRSVFTDRMKRGWSAVDAATKPADVRYRRKAMR